MGIDLAFLSGFLKEAIQKAVAAGVPPDFFSYLLILPLLTTLVASARHLLGLTTYGTFLPAIISVIWAETGFEFGLVIFIVLIIWAKVARWVVQKSMIKSFKVNYLPRMAIFLLFISLGIFGLGLWPASLGLFKEKGLIFPLLILVLIIHNLIETQISLSKKEAQTLIWETGAFALAGYLLLNWPFLGKFVLQHPGLTILIILAFNIYVGRYVGFRLLEYYRFKSIIKKS